jgi:hypothetical protein
MSMVEEHKPQTEDQIARLIATDRWLLSSGLVTDSVQQNLLAYGYLSSEKVKSVEVALDVNEKKVAYKIYLSKSHYKGYLKFRKRLQAKKPIPLRTKLNFLVSLKIQEIYTWFVKGEKIAGFSKRLWVLAAASAYALYKNPNFYMEAAFAAIAIWGLLAYTGSVVTEGISDIRINVEGNLKKMVGDYIPEYELSIEVLPK